MSESRASEQNSAVRPRFRSDIQGLRAIAILAVVAYHADLPVPGGFTGVDVFFVISGYVITGLLVAEHAREGRLQLWGFYKRRIRRLVPAAALMITVTITASAVLLSPIGSAQESAGNAGSAASIFLANAYFYVFSGGYFQPVAESNPFLHTWSLSVEEQFYLIFPALVITAYALRKRVRRLPLRSIVVLLAVASFGISIALLKAPEVFDAIPGSLIPNAEFAASFDFFSPVTRAWEFLIGTLVAITLPRILIGKLTGLALAWAGIGLLAVSFWLIDDQAPFPGYLALIPVCGAALLLIAGGIAAPSWPTRLLSTRPAVFIGGISYSWYLWHWPVIVFAFVWFPRNSLVGTIAAVLAIIPALVSYHWIEKPIHLGRKLRSRRGTVAILILGIAIPLFAGQALVYAWSKNWGNETISRIQQSTTPLHVDGAAGCTGLIPLSVTPRPNCLWSIPDAKGTVLLIGDSNAGHFSEAVIAEGNSLGYNVEIATTGGCPLVLDPPVDNPECKEFVAQSLDAIATKIPPYSAVLISRSYTYPFVQSSDAPARNRAAEMWATSLSATVDQVSEVSPVILFSPIPQFNGEEFPECLYPSLLTGFDPACGVADRSTLSELPDLLFAAEKAAVGPNATYIDTAGVICEDGCEAFHGGELQYRDAAHLSVAGAARFREQIREALEESIRQRWERQ